MNLLIIKILKVPIIQIQILINKISLLNNKIIMHFIINIKNNLQDNIQL